MGDFHDLEMSICARLGQSFASSFQRDFMLVGMRLLFLTVKVYGTNYVFSDGIGKISEFTVELPQNVLDVLVRQCYLNRQLVTLLSTLGVKDGVLEQKQNEAVEQLDAILHDSLKAQEALELMSPGENNYNILKEMLNCGYMPDAEPFLQ
ncbi:hypothetical protein HAX54_019278 [Datura stramonium]|uniref:RNA-dependent RNA polymerase n=1 Tax=Datura stramonium TaxID=4076 RepID=A0ABS8S1U7_DATST|nr:hypothetical protein [Datura stramonium]